ncbi:MAG: InlB B-repeat-containing protein [Clostridia bacterium]|nr:InlB B-repeat-containing protein [Clostridia bacterium]
MRLTKKLLAVLLAVVFTLSAGLMNAVAASGLKVSAAPAEALADSDYDGIPDAYDTAPSSNTFSAKMKSGHDDLTTVSYTMDLRNFFGGNTVYHPELASVSVIGSALAYLGEVNGDAYVTFTPAVAWEGGSVSKADGLQLLQMHGFEDPVDYKLDDYGDDDICEVLMGHQTVTYNGETKVIVALWVRGTNPVSEQEWSSNFNVGDLVRFFDAYDSVEGKSPRQSNDDWTRKTNHRGFDVCATRLLKYLKDYYFDDHVQPALDAAPGSTAVYWLTGHSRGAAVANLMASYLIDEGCEVYAYTFAAPYNTANTEASAEKYDCIFNLVNSNDFVPTLPMPEWGFTRYGRTANVDASQYSTQIKTATGVDYSGKYLTASDISTMLGKFICITGENSDRNNPGKILGWREVYVYHCGHDHAGETCGNYQSTTFRAWGLFGPYENDYYNKYAIRLQKYSYWEGGICQTPAYCMQVLVELMVGVANGSYLGSGWTYLTSNKLADKFDFDKQSLVSYATKLTEPHFMDTYSVIQAQINLEGNPGSRFRTQRYYTVTDSDGGRPAHTHVYTYVPYEGHEPTCTETGFGYRYCLCSEANADYYDDYQKNVVIPALGHDWGAPEYEWSEGYLTCTATRVCAREAGHTETETVEADFTVVTPATYEAPGLGRWTAVFENEAFGTRTIDVEMPQLQNPQVYHTVTFVDWDGAELSVQQVLDGESAVAPEDPIREGYTFIGWEGDYTNVTSDLIIIARYEKNAAPGLIGDVNCDGTVDFSDVTDLFAFLMNSRLLSEQGLLNAEINGDGTLTMDDVSALYSLILNG